MYSPFLFSAACSFLVELKALNTCTLYLLMVPIVLCSSGLAEVCGSGEMRFEITYYSWLSFGVSALLVDMYLV